MFNMDFECSSPLVVILRLLLRSFNLLRLFCFMSSCASWNALLDSDWSYWRAGVRSPDVKLDIDSTATATSSSYLQFWSLIWRSSIMVSVSASFSLSSLCCFITVSILALGTQSRSKESSPSQLLSAVLSLPLVDVHRSIMGMLDLMGAWLTPFGNQDLCELKDDISCFFKEVMLLENSPRVVSRNGTPAIVIRFFIYFFIFLTS